MTSTGKNTKTEAKSQLKELLEAGSENLLPEILQLGLQQLMELERDDYIGAAPYERSEKALVAALAEA
jgi:transposase-like protein